ncbi:5-formyltetrahydrofolate cyclo-ligase [Brevundimonas sp.]
MTDKHQLRAAMRATRKRLAVETPDAAEAVVQHLSELLEIMFETSVSFAEEQKRRRFTAAVYKAVGSELGALPLARALQAKDVDLALPVATSAGQPLVFRRWSPGDPLELDASGVPAPLPLAEVVVPDVIFIPLLAVDQRGYRLGQGGGYYDRTLHALRSASPVPWFIGLCYAGQMVDSLPEEVHDERLHGVLTEAFCTTVWKA